MIIEVNSIQLELVSLDKFKYLSKIKKNKQSGEWYFYIGYYDTAEVYLYYDEQEAAVLDIANILHAVNPVIDLDEGNKEAA
jgi:hypothetical protein